LNPPPEFRRGEAAFGCHIGVAAGRSQGANPMKKFLIAFSIAGLVGGAAVAPAMANEMDFTKVDANGDGKITMEEATAAGWTWTDDQFKTADADGDGGLNAEEFKVASAQ
jgi:hypothetical protein